jgi:pimeloyl-ACP methyl ester carboxylesterase
MRRIARLADLLRKQPLRGRAPNADGEVADVEVDVGGLIYLVTSAATAPSIYREMDAAVRAALRPGRPYEKPLLRLARETYYVGGAGPVREYSEGLYIAVACNDYPQPYDMTARIAIRKDQYAQTLRALKTERPRVFAPFTVQEWVTSPVEYFDSCIEWPRPSRVDPPVPPGAMFPDVPTLMLAGDLDSLTSPEGAQQTAAAFPNSTYVEVANMTHVAAITDFGHCASRIVRRFVRTMDAGDISCAADYPEIRVVDKFVRDSNALDWATGRPRTVRVAAATVGDVIARWLGMVGFEGAGIQGGRFTTTGLRHVRWRLHGVRWVRDVTVSGRVDWKRRTGEVAATVRVSGLGAVPGRLALAWNSWDQLGRATARGRLDGHRVDMSFPAP